MHDMTSRNIISECLHYVSTSKCYNIIVRKVLIEKFVLNSVVRPYLPSLESRIKNAGLVLSLTVEDTIAVLSAQFAMLYITVRIVKADLLWKWICECLICGVGAMYVSLLSIFETPPSKQKKDLLLFCWVVIASLRVIETVCFSIYRRCFFATLAWWWYITKSSIVYMLMLHPTSMNENSVTSKAFRSAHQSFQLLVSRTFGNNNICSHMQTENQMDDVQSRECPEVEQLPLHRILSNASQGLVSELGMTPLMKEEDIQLQPTDDTHEDNKQTEKPQLDKICCEKLADGVDTFTIDNEKISDKKISESIDTFTTDSEKIHHTELTGSVDIFTTDYDKKYNEFSESIDTSTGKSNEDNYIHDILVEKESSSNNNDDDDQSAFSFVDVSGDDIISIEGIEPNSK